MSKIEMKFESDELFNNIPGKHCLMLLIKILKRKYPKIGNLQFDRVSFALASNCTFNNMEEIRKSIAKYLTS